MPWTRIGALLLLSSVACGAIRVERPDRVVGIDPCSLLTAHEVAEVLPDAPAKPVHVVYEESWECRWVNRRREMVRTATDIETRSSEHYADVYKAVDELKPHTGIAGVSRFAFHELHVLSPENVLWFVHVCLRGKDDAQTDDVLASLGKKVSARIDSGFPGKADVPPPTAGEAPRSCDFQHGGP